MIAFSWRQFRAQAGIGFALLAVLAVVLAVTGPHLLHLYEQTVAACRAVHGAAAACPSSSVSNTDRGIQVAVFALQLVGPALIGIFWGAPLLARELEAGTFRLAWTQSVSRRRWLFTKLALIGTASGVLAGLLSVIVDWWISPIDDMSPNRFSPALFGVRGIVPIGYAVFAFALGATLGLLLRRTVPAMAATIVGFIGARLAVTYGIRPHYMAPLHIKESIFTGAGFGFSQSGAGIQVVASPINPPNAWVLSSAVVNDAGQSPTTAFLTKSCPNLPGLNGSGPPPGGGNAVAVSPAGQSAFNHCMNVIAAHYHTLVTYQPADRFWTFQVAEVLLFFGAACVLGGLSYWWLRHRLV
jgi:hypothetical protein